MSNSNSFKARCKEWFESGKGLVLAFALVGGVFITLGIRRFHIRAEPFGWQSLVGCIIAAFVAFFVVMIGDYVLHHARLVFLLWAAFTIALAIIHPSFAIGLGLALWFILFSQWRQERAARRTK